MFNAVDIVVACDGPMCGHVMVFNLGDLPFPATRKEIRQGILDQGWLIRFQRSDTPWQWSTISKEADAGHESMIWFMANNERLYEDVELDKHYCSKGCAQG